MPTFLGASGWRCTPDEHPLDGASNRHATWCRSHHSRTIDLRLAIALADTGTIRWNYFGLSERTERHRLRRHAHASSAPSPVVAAMIPPPRIHVYIPPAVYGFRHSPASLVVCHNDASWHLHSAPPLAHQARAWCTSSSSLYPHLHLCRGRQRVQHPHALRQLRQPQRTTCPLQPRSTSHLRAISSRSEPVR
jgi:hypothetical protein